MDPQKDSVRLVGIIAVVAVLAGGIYLIGHNNSADLNTSKVLPTNTSGGQVALAPELATLCADGAPHILLTSPKSGDFLIANNLDVTWQSCNTGNAQVGINLLHDSAIESAAYYKDFTSGDYAFNNLTNDGSESISLANMNGAGGRYKVRVAVYTTNATSEGDWLMIYENPSYLMQAQSSVNLAPGATVFRIPKSAASLYVTLKAAGGGGGGGGGDIDYVTEEINQHAIGGSGGGGEGGEKKTATLAVTPGQLALVTVGAGGSNGQAGTSNNSSNSSDGDAAGDGDSGGNGGKTEFKIPVYNTNTSTWTYTTYQTIGGFGGAGGEGAHWGDNSNALNGAAGSAGASPSAGIDGQGTIGGNGPGGIGGNAGQPGGAGSITASWPAPTKGGTKGTTDVTSGIN